MSKQSKIGSILSGLAEAASVLATPMTPEQEVQYLRRELLRQQQQHLRDQTEDRRTLSDLRAQLHWARTTIDADRQRHDAERRTLQAKIDRLELANRLDGKRPERDPMFGSLGDDFFAGMSPVARAMVREGMADFRKRNG